MMSEFGNVIHAVRPWDSHYASYFPNKRYLRSKPQGEQAEIDACLHCPFQECQSRSAHCKTFRLAYIAKVNG